MPTLLEIAQGRQVPLSSGIMQAVATDAPTLAAFDARTVSGLRYMTLALVGLPSASGFKDFGEGFEHESARLALREFEAKLAGGKVEVEQITARRWDEAHGPAGTTYFDLQLMARMRSELRHINRQIYYGTVADAKGFPGLKQLTPYVTGNVLALTDDPGADDYEKTVVNAGGSTATTASSVYSVIEGEMECQLILANDGGGEFFTMDEPIRQHIAPDSDKPAATLEHLVTQIYGFFGISVSGMNETPGGVVPTQYSVRRLANLTEDSGKGVDDGKLEALVLSHGDNRTPSRIYMNGRSGRQWADSRSATSSTLFLGMSGDARNNTGSMRAARPTNFEGIPVVYDSAIKSNDAIEAT
jgi:hypothetical protein